MPKWIQDNAIALLLMGGSLIGLYITMHGELLVIETTLRDRGTHINTLRETANEVVQLRSEQEITRRYWDRFEKVMNRNTAALAEVSAAVSAIDQRLLQHDKRIERLEDKQ